MMTLRNRLAICFGAAMLASCGGPGSGSPPTAPFAFPSVEVRSARRQPPAVKYRIVTDFGNTYEGNYPNGGLLDVKGTLYGTTEIGGAFGQGNVFSLSTAGTENVLHSFGGPLDASNPEGDLINVNGTFYGVAPGNGVYLWGSVYAITRSGGESVVYNFHGGPSDGKEADSPILTYVNHKFYGVTSGGGATGRGTVYSLTTKGVERVLHSFSGGQSDGAWPDGGLVYLDGLFYGTTTAGGSDYSSRDLGDGIIFSITPSGTESVLYRFPHGGSNGCCPNAGLINVKGVLYGTSAGGGAYGGGTVFGITPGGNFTTLYNFGHGADASGPVAPLLPVHGVLYGTTSGGGAYGKGTIFRVSLSGAEKVLHSFRYGNDGTKPLAGLTNVKGTLYGTTSGGGATGNGTVFAVTP